MGINSRHEPSKTVQPIIKVWTDGGCHPNPGKGKWAFALSKKEYFKGGLNHTTNNEMELTAILNSIEYIRKNISKTSKILVLSDSKYCVDGFNSWMHGWANRGWKKSGNGQIKNLPLWKRLYKLSDNVRLKWIKGHNNNDMNDFVDSLCTMSTFRR